MTLTSPVENLLLKRISANDAPWPADDYLSAPHIYTSEASDGARVYREMVEEPIPNCRSTDMEICDYLHKCCRFAQELPNVSSEKETAMTDPRTSREKPHVTDKEQTELQKLFEAHQALKRLGWTDPRYSGIEDGEHFDVIELGSTGVHRAHKDGPYVWVDGEWPSHPLLVRKLKEPR